MEHFAWILKFALRMFTFITHFEEKTLAATKLFLSLTHIDLVVAVSSRAVRIFIRAVDVFPALSLRGVWPSYGTCSLKGFQGNCARGRTGHMINFCSRAFQSTESPNTLVIFQIAMILTRHGINKNFACN